MSKVYGNSVQILATGRELLPGESEVPYRRWIKVMTVGKQWVQGYSEPYDITDEDCESAVRAFDHRVAHGHRGMIFDYNHGSMRGTTPEQQAGAGHGIKIRHDKGVGLFALGQFTSRAEAMLRAEDFEFVSPEIHSAYRDHDTGKAVKGTYIPAVALTARPQLGDGMEKIAASENDEPFAADAPPAKPDAAKEQDMSDNKDPKVNLGEYAEIIGDLTPEALAAKLEDAGKAADKIVTLSQKISDLGDSETKINLLATELSGSRAEVKTLSDQLQVITDRESDRVASDLVASYATKITPATAPHFLVMAKSDPSGFKALAETLPDVVNLTRRGTAHADEDTGADDAPLDLMGGIEAYANANPVDGKPMGFNDAYDAFVKTDEGKELARKHTSNIPSRG